MDPYDAQLFFALLTVATLTGTIMLIACRLMSRRVAGPARAVDALAPFANQLAAAIALTAMFGSLYFSEVANYVPCTLCWYQRIAMYPLGIVLAIAAVRRDRAVRWYVAPAAAIGAAISMYHWLLERFPDLDAGVCSVQAPCEFVWFERFGFVTLPFMALTGFLAVITLVTLPDRSDHGNNDIPPEDLVPWRAGTRREGPKGPLESRLVDRGRDRGRGRHRSADRRDRQRQREHSDN